MAGWHAGFDLCPGAGFRSLSVQAAWVGGDRNARKRAPLYHEKMVDRRIYILLLQLGLRSIGMGVSSSRKVVLSIVR